MRRPLNQYHLTARDAARLLSLANSLRGLAVAHCNHGLTPRQETRESNMREEVRTIAGWYGLTADCNGDPRGAVVRLQGEGLPSNSLGGGWGL